MGWSMLTEMVTLHIVVGILVCISMLAIALNAAMRQATKVVVLHAFAKMPICHQSMNQ